MKQLLIVILKVCPCVRVSLYSLCVPGGFDGRTGFDMNTSQIFPQGVLAAISMVGGETGDAVTRTRASLSQGFPSAQWPFLPY